MRTAMLGMCSNESGIDRSRTRISPLAASEVLAVSLVLP
jgi:hypothetical protein